MTNEWLIFFLSGNTNKRTREQRGRWRLKTMACTIGTQLVIICHTLT